MQNNSSPPAVQQQKLTKSLFMENSIQQPQTGKELPNNNNNNNNNQPTGGSSPNNKNINTSSGEHQPRHASHHHVIGRVINNLRTVLGHPPPPPPERHQSANTNTEKKTTPPTKNTLQSPSPASRVSTPSKTPNQQELDAAKSHAGSHNEEISVEAGSFSMVDGKPGLALTLPPAKASGNALAQNAKTFELLGHINENNNNVDNNNIRIELTAASNSATHPIQAQANNQAGNLSVKQDDAMPAPSVNLMNTQDVGVDKDVSTAAGKVGKMLTNPHSSLNKSERAHSGAVDSKTGELLEPNNTAFDDISLVPHDYNGRFKAVTKLGSGTFGQVFLCAFIPSATTPRTTMTNNNNSSARHNYGNASCTNNSIPVRHMSGAAIGGGDDTRFAAAGSPLGTSANFPKMQPNANGLKRTPSSGAVHGYTNLLQRANDNTKSNTGEVPALQHASPIEPIQRSGKEPRRSPPSQSGDDQDLTRSPHHRQSGSDPRRTHNDSGASINSSAANENSSRRIAQELGLPSEKNGSRISNSIPLLIDNPAGDVSSLAATRPVVNIHGVSYRREQIFVCKMEILPDKIQEQEEQLRQVSSRVFGKPLTSVALPHLPRQGFVVGIHSGVETLGRSTPQNNNIETAPNSCRDFPLEIDTQPAENSTKRYVINRYAEDSDSASSSEDESGARGSDASMDAHSSRRNRSLSQQKRRRKQQSRASSMNEGSSGVSRGSAISEGTRISILSGLAHATRMTRESHLLSNLAHPNIVSYIDCFRRGNTQYLFLEYVDGGDLERELEIRRVGRQYLSEESVLFLFVQVCLAIEYLHRNNILHRDIKLANILKSKNFICKLSDFGTAEKFDVDTYNLVDEKLRGTPSFLAPELWIGAPYSEKADIYSLGVVLYALLDPFGLPYNAQTIPALREQVLKSAPRPLTRPVSPGVAVILRALLRKDPTRRPSVLEILTSETMQKPLDSYRNKMAELVRSSNATKVDQNWLAVLEDHIAIVRGKELPSLDRRSNRKGKNDINGGTTQGKTDAKRGSSPGGNENDDEHMKHQNSLFLIKNQLPDGAPNFDESNCGDNQHQSHRRSRRHTNKMESNAAPAGPDRASSDASRCSRTSQSSRRDYERSRLSEVRSRGGSGQSRRSAASSEHHQSQRALRATGLMTHESNDDSDGDVLVKMLQQQKQTNQIKK